MAMNQLKTIIRHSEYLMDMLKPDTDLPEWVQSKITLATDYIQTAADYMYSEMKEETEIDEATSAAARLQKAFQRAKEQREREERAGEALLKPKRADVFHPGPAANEKYVAKQIEKEKLKKEDVEQISEGRPSQRHPLEGHEYHKKSDEALVHIAKDAHAAAEAMKGHNTQAENKYRDQANDSATVRHFRKTSGMPDWYKKKYGHVDEEVQQEGAVPSTEKVITVKHKTSGKTLRVASHAAEKYKKIGYHPVNEASEVGDDPINKGSQDVVKKGNKTVANQTLDNMKEDAPPIHVRSLYAQTYAKHGKTASQSKAAQELAYRAVEKKHGPEMRKKLSDYHNKNQNESVEQIDEIIGSHVKNDIKSLDATSFAKKHGVKKSEAKINEASSAALRLQKALQRAKEQREREERAGAALLKPKPRVQQPVKEETNKKDEPPFEGPYKKTPSAVTGKYGSGYSTARHLARQALSRASAKYKTPIKEEGELSRKSQIIKDAAKKGKKKNEFNSDPIISKTEVKM